MFANNIFENDSLFQGLVSILVVFAIIFLVPGSVMPQTSDRADASETREADKNSGDKTKSDPTLVQGENKIIIKEGNGKNTFTSKKLRGEERLIKISGAEKNGVLIFGLIYVAVVCVSLAKIQWIPVMFQNGNAEFRMACKVKIIYIMLSFIVLQIGVLINGYGIRTLGGGRYLINVNGVENPKTGKKLSGKFNFVYKCKQTIGLIAVTIVLVRGFARQRARCLIEGDPRLYY